MNDRRPDGPRGIPSAHPAVPVLVRLRSYVSLETVERARDRISLRMVAVALIVVGVLTCMVPFGILAFGMWQEDQLTQHWAESTAAQAADPSSPAVATAPTAVDAPGPSPTTTVTSRGAPVEAAFAIRVPKIGYYAAVREGVSLNILAVGPGHYPSTAMPGQPGLVGIAAHNTYWIPFGRLGQGDTVELDTRAGHFTYRVTGTRIVNPDDRSALASNGTRSLALTTCWPLWAGDLATQRLVIFAQQA